MKSNLRRRRGLVVVERGLEIRGQVRLEVEVGSRGVRLDII